MPPATAKPSIAAISGLRDARWAIPAKPRSPNQGASPLTNAPRSIPAQKKPPAPVSTPTDRLSSLVELLQGTGHARGHGGVDRVAHLGAVERDQQYAPRRSVRTTASIVIIHGRHYGANGVNSKRRRWRGELARLGVLVARWPPGDRLAELADPLTEGAGEFGQALGAQHDERDRADEQQMHGVLDAHDPQASGRSGPSTCDLPIRPSDPPPTLPARGRRTVSPPRPPLPSAGDAEPFWPAQATILAAIGLQLLLPARLTVGPSWLIPGP